MHIYLMYYIENNMLNLGIGRIVGLCNGGIGLGLMDLGNCLESCCNMCKYLRYYNILVYHHKVHNIQYYYISNNIQYCISNINTMLN